jgi:hypothetical protein
MDSGPAPPAHPGMTAVKSCPTRCAAHPKSCCCASRIAGAPGDQESRGWNVNSMGVSSKKLPKEEDCSMRLHLDRKYLDGLDGNVVAFVVISLIIIIAFVY